MFCKRWSPFNYERCNLLMKCLMLSVIWTSLLASFSLLIDDSSKTTTLLILLFVGWAIIGVTGVVIVKKNLEKYPSLLYNQKPEKIENMIKFQL